MPRRIRPGGPWLDAGELAPNAADQVPFSRAWLPSVLATWAVVPIVLWSNGFSIPQASANVPLNRGWVETVRQQWEPPAWSQQVRRFVPQGGIAADPPPPLERPWFGAVVSSWQDWQQPVQSRAKQIVSVDNPPFEQERLPDAIRRAWEPEPWTTQERLQLVQPAASGDNPPFEQERLPDVIRRAWEPSPVLIWQNGVLVQGTPADQPVGLRSWFPGVRDAWEPQAYPPQGWRDIVQGAVATADNPPFEQERLPESVRRAWDPEPWAPQASRRAIPSTPDQPVGRENRLQAIALWPQEPPPTQLRRNVPQGAAAPSADDPPWGYQPWLKTVTDAWAQAPVLLWQNGVLAQSAPADQPTGLHSWLRGVLASWEPAPDPAQGWRRLAQGTAPAADQPPRGYRPWLRIALASWAQAPVLVWQNGIVVQDAAAPASQPFGRRDTLSGLVASWEQRLVPLWAIAGSQAQDLPPFERPWLSAIIGAWEPEWVRPQALRHLAQQGPAPDVPPVTDRPWLALVQQQWEPLPYPAQGWKHVIQPITVSADNPPFGTRPWLSSTIAQWTPEPAAAPSRRLVVQQPIDNPPFSHRSAISQVLAWQPGPYQVMPVRYMVQGIPVPPDTFTAGVREHFFAEGSKRRVGDSSAAGAKRRVGDSTATGRKRRLGEEKT